MPGTPAIVSRTIALCPYLCAKNVSAMNLKNFVMDIAKKFEIFFIKPLVKRQIYDKMIHYFEEEAVKSYTEYLKMVESGEVENVPAPQLAIDYYKMKKNAKLSDLIKKVRADEQHHSKINLKYSEK